jgi:hypothetical protein
MEGLSVRASLPRNLAVSAALVALLGGACSGAGGEQPRASAASATSSTTTSSTTTTTEAPTTTTEAPTTTTEAPTDRAFVFDASDGDLRVTLRIQTDLRWPGWVQGVVQVDDPTGRVDQEGYPEVRGTVGSMGTGYPILTLFYGDFDNCPDHLTDPELKPVGFVDAQDTTVPSGTYRIRADFVTGICTDHEDHAAIEGEIVVP